MKILVTGGTGYIGSHTVVELINSGYEPIIIDNLSNSKVEVLDSLEEITGKRVKFYENDVCDVEALNKIFDENEIDAVMHFAGYKAVGEVLTGIEDVNAADAKNEIYTLGGVRVQKAQKGVNIINGKKVMVK